MADDVQRITGTSAKSAARLCNFVTSEAKLLTSHIQYLDTEVAPVIKGMIGPWVDLFGYASRRGNSAFNTVLSEQRIKAVKERIATYAENVNFQQQTGFGDSQSGPDASDNSGYYRAVDVMVYATKPPPRPVPVAPKPPEATKFEIRVVGGGSASILGQADNFFFQITDLIRKKTCFFFYTGVGIGISIPKIPGPGSVTKAGPPTKFTTSRPVELYNFNTRAQLYQDAGATLGSASIGGTMRLAMLNFSDSQGFVATKPGMIPIEGGSGMQMPGLGSVTEGVLAKVSDVFEFNGY